MTTHHTPETSGTPSATVSTVRWSSGTNIAAGAWLLAAPFLLGYGAVAAAVANAIVVGLLVLGLAWYRAANPSKARVSMRPGAVHPAAP